MAPRPTETTIAPLVRCHSGFAWQPPRGHARVIAAGEELRGDHEIVTANPDHFAPVGLSSQEYRAAALRLAQRKGDANARAHAEAVRREAKRGPVQRILSPWFPDSQADPTLG